MPYLGYKLMLVVYGSFCNPRGENGYLGTYEGSDLGAQTMAILSGIMIW